MAKVVVVLGMHRSGTSMLSRALSILGIDLGKRILTDPGFDNRLGYWEQSEIVEVQETLLQELDRGAWEPNGPLPMPAGWLDARATQIARDKLLEIVGRELDGRNLWGFKDPRTARLIPLWDEIFRRLHVDPVFVLVVRHPVEVSDSLMARQGLPPLHAEMLWLTYNMDILQHAGARLGHIAHYDRWLSHPDQELQRLAESLGIARHSELPTQQTVVEDLRHQTANRTPFMPQSEALYDLLRSVETGRTLSPDADKLASSFRETVAFLGRAPHVMQYLLSMPSPEKSAGLPIPSFPVALDRGNTQSLPMGDRPSHARLLNGNKWCAPTKIGFVLHANGPGKPPVQFAYCNVPLSAGHTKFLATLVFNSMEHIQRVRAEAISNEGQPLGATTVIGHPGQTIDLSLSIRAPAPGLCSLMLEVAVEAAPNAFNCRVAVLHPQLVRAD